MATKISDYFPPVFDAALLAVHAYNPDAPLPPGETYGTQRVNY